MEAETASARMPWHGRDQRGLALIMVLWSMVLLSLVAGAVMQRSTEDLRQARNLADSMQAELAADGAVNLAILDLALSPAAWPPDGEERRVAIGGAEVSLMITDESGRVDLNTASLLLLAELIGVLGASGDEATALADMIGDFRDRDSDVRSRGAEDADYAAAGLSLGARDAPFEDVGELGRVLGMPPDLRRALINHVTTFTGLPEPNRASASPQVRAAMARFDRRKQAAGVEAGSLVIVTGGEGQRSRRFARITARAATAEGARYVREAVVELRPGERPPYSVLAWQRRWDDAN